MRKKHQKGLNEEGWFLALPYGGSHHQDFKVERVSNNPERGKELSKNTDTQVHSEEGELIPVSAVKCSRGPTCVR